MIARKDKPEWTKVIDKTLRDFRPQRVDLGDPVYRMLLVKVIEDAINEWKRVKREE